MRERDAEEDGVEEGRGGGRAGVKDTAHKHLECDTLVSSTHIKALGREGVCDLTPAQPTSTPPEMAAAAATGKERRLFVALFDFVFTEIAFTYAPRTEIKQIRKCLRHSRRPPVPRRDVVLTPFRGHACDLVRARSRRSRSYPFLLVAA